MISKSFAELLMHLFDQFQRSSQTDVKQLWNQNTICLAKIMQRSSHSESMDAKYSQVSMMVKSHDSLLQKLSSQITDMQKQFSSKEPSPQLPQTTSNQLAKQLKISTNLEDIRVE
jgi:hypothetical protein